MLVPPNFCTIHRRGAAESVEWLYFVKPLGMDLGVSIGRDSGGGCACGGVADQAECQLDLMRYCCTLDRVSV